MGKSGPRTHANHTAATEAARVEPGVWMLAHVYPTADSGYNAVRRIPGAERMPSYRPARTFEAYAAPVIDGGMAVWVRYVAVLPKPQPRPSSMTYRVCDRGSSRDYTGVSVRTVIVAAECPVCGGPRGEAKQHRFHEDGDWYVVDTWSNRCGHRDAYTAVLAEHRARLEELEAAEEADAARSVCTGPAEAGEFTAAVLLLNALGASIPRLQGRQACLYLDMRGHREAARRVQEELVLRYGRMSVRQAAQFLTQLAAAREACAQCENGRTSYESWDGKTVIVRCPVCRREVGHV